MPSLQEKSRAVRRLCGITQAEVAELAHLSLKTYQRMEQGTSAVTESTLEALAAVFNCTADDIRHFDLDANQFGPSPHQLPEIVENVEKENSLLKAENNYLKDLLKTTLGEVPDLREMQGGGQTEQTHEN